MGIESRAKVNQADYIYQVHTKVNEFPGSLLRSINLFKSRMEWFLFINPSRPDPGRREKLNLNFYF